ncbi:alpha/beta fold hydrolase [Nocardia terpenica]|uniref:alpha/beta hydrolase n=1 Tax=Nocardia terpenica TaxID=455432 RepID=UPI0018932EE7|nr:alpha/beta fold hydrolase [Nocardia terpenica]MBF6064443.1 alpha/beta fold hydrolase [Nocardia terpenica]MBF6106933.1 alpha/beta fold hydrolase [Nocardia terpenica]MBF6114411.1 alpha/beta fold hydrolase [Nocardia terpenica]MBF6121503.1 alpha/beta fold hydrolase [Nocardia terpenica]MBF6153918.1 alpha/beta fold hydrolase [Nocardia terpenica]
MTALATTANELPLLLDSGPNTVFAVGTLPTGLPNGLGVAILPGAGIASSGNARAWVELARRLAAQGYLVDRLDYRGVGESTGEVDRFDLLETFTDDAVAAVHWLQRNGAAEVVLVGECYGARVALDALAALPDVRAVLALFPPLTVAAPGTDQAARETGHFVAALRRELARGVRIRAIYGVEDVDLEPFRSAVEQVRGAHSGLSLRLAENKLHGIASAAARDAVIRLVQQALGDYRRYIESR